MGDECNCPLVSTFFGTTLLGNWDEDWPFPEIPYLLDISICASKILFTIQLSALGVDLNAMLSHFSRVWLFVTPWTATCQASLSMGFSRQEYWSGLPYPPPGDLPDPGIEPASLKSPTLASKFFTTSATWETDLIGYNNGFPYLWLILF